jgi:uncharacterized protein YidB (DUF937 family)
MMALLGLLAVAGYQNREKIGELLGGLGRGQAGQPESQGGLGGILGGLGGLLGGQNPGSILSGGLGDLVDRFKQSGQGQAADSWVSKGANEPVNESQLEQALGPDVLDTLSRETGLSREELLQRLSRDLPQAVDKFTPEGRVPTPEEAARYL